MIVTIWVERKPEHTTLPSTFALIREHIKFPCIGNKLLVETSRDHFKLDGNLSWIDPPTGKMFARVKSNLMLEVVLTIGFEKEIAKFNKSEGVHEMDALVSSAEISLAIWAMKGSVCAVVDGFLIFVSSISIWAT